MVFAHNEGAERAYSDAPAQVAGVQWAQEVAFVEHHGGDRIVVCGEFAGRYVDADDEQEFVGRKTVEARSPAPWPAPCSVRRVSPRGCRQRPGRERRRGKVQPTASQRLLRRGPQLCARGILGGDLAGRPRGRRTPRRLTINHAPQCFWSRHGQTHTGGRSSTATPTQAVARAATLRPLNPG
jgi:hypothetical protein